MIISFSLNIALLIHLLILSSASAHLHTGYGKSLNVITSLWRILKLMIFYPKFF